MKAMKDAADSHEVIAIDVALVPPEWAQDRARAINARLCAERPDGFRFDATHLPHISLAQLFLGRRNRAVFIRQIDPILHATRPLTLRATQVAAHGSTVSLLVERSPGLYSLHQRLMDAAAAFEEPGGTPDAFYSVADIGREMARVEDVAWVSNYRSQASYAAFFPHITLGIGTAPEPGEPFDFVASRVGLFHLGRFCACRAVFYEWALLPL